VHFGNLANMGSKEAHPERAARRPTLREVSVRLFHRRPATVIGVAAAIGAGLVATGSGAARAEAAATSPPIRPTQPSLVTPLLSPRRLPGWVAATVAGERLQATLTATLAQPLLTGAGARSCAAVSQGGAVRAVIHGASPVVPASNMKLLTATAVFDKLGAAATYTTTVGSAAPVVGGVLRGNLDLIGGGDPLLRTAGYQASLPDQAGVFTDVTRLAAAVRARGITEIDGSVVGDESRYDAVRVIPTWAPRYAAEGDVGPLSALDIDDGHLNGATGVAADATPPAASAQYFATLLRSVGVTVAGGGVAGTAPKGIRPLASVSSAPMAEVVGEILKESDDTGAELLVKELGYRFGGAGTTTAGLAVLRADLAGDHLPLSATVFADGSGLDTLDRVSCDLVAALLARAGPVGPLAAALPVAAESGTLRNRLRGTPAAGRVVAKTGTLFGVSALSGFVKPAAGARAAVGATAALGAPLVFSLILNGLPPNDAGEAAGITVGNQVALTLAGFPTTPAVAQLSPQAVRQP
jgi:D-alanyl-D-alanine carboxypeptidase/D-alanyl-D-alanine-endopeptidase (penicillin-binding protein 4)